MPKSLLLSLAFLCCVSGTAWLSLAMEVHWQQVKGPQVQLPPGTALTLRAAGITALLLSMLLCGQADHASMAALVWIMSVSASAMLVALALAWRPGWLAPLAMLAGRR